jgi:FkbM family methyltransferase
MLVPLSELNKIWNVSPNGVVHVGAHLGEEATEYEKYQWLPVIWIEAQPSLVSRLKESLNSSNHTVIEAAIWEEEGVKLNLNIASNSHSSSLLNFGTHSDSYPNVHVESQLEVVTKRLDSLINFEKMPNFINLDIQGVELPAIKSLGKLIQKLDYIYTEVNRKEVYLDCTLVKNLDLYLQNFGFSRKITRWYITQGWGDALYVRDDVHIRRNFKQFVDSYVIQMQFYCSQIPVLKRWVKF